MPGRVHLVDRARQFRLVNVRWICNNPGMFRFSRPWLSIVGRLSRAGISLLAILALALVAPAELRHLAQHGHTAPHGECHKDADPRVPCQPCAQFQQILQIEPADATVPPVEDPAATVELPRLRPTGKPDRISLSSRSPPLS